MFRFERLRVWHKAIELYEAVDEVSRRFPGKPEFFLSDQLRRATLSISSNIAEGSGRETTKDAQHFYTIAKGSAFEVVSIATVCHRRGLISTEHYRDMYGRVEDIAKMLSGLKRVQQTD
ncbi:MAG TPA: four helix bundle protein [Candidatus Methylomirabilis sp.]|nr:four helix bundle protein [Candidatus Methylomirabilis sp.]